MKKFGASLESGRVLVWPHVNSDFVAVCLGFPGLSGETSNLENPHFLERISSLLRAANFYPATRTLKDLLGTF